jgi:hypothetical protein
MLYLIHNKGGNMNRIIFVGIFLLGCGSEVDGVLFQEEDSKDDFFSYSEIADDQSQDEMITCRKDYDCDDDEACTYDWCEQGQCQHKIIAGCCNNNGECEDNDICTLTSCENHQCKVEAITDCCYQKSDCEEKKCFNFDCIANQCVYKSEVGCCADDSDCDDEDSCTVDRCNGADICEFNPLCEYPYACLEGQCFPPSQCQADEDCGAGEVFFCQSNILNWQILSAECDTASGKCHEQKIVIDCPLGCEQNTCRCEWVGDCNSPNIPKLYGICQLGGYCSYGFDAE